MAYKPGLSLSWNEAKLLLIVNQLWLLWISRWYIASHVLASRRENPERQSWIFRLLRVIYRLDIILTAAVVVYKTWRLMSRSSMLRLGAPLSTLLPRPALRMFWNRRAGS